SCKPYWAVNTLGLGLLFLAATLLPLFAPKPGHQEHKLPSQLVKDVRNATPQVIDVNKAGPRRYPPAFRRLNRPDPGAMGIHYVNGDLVKDGKIEKESPEALIYEPVNGKLRLVGVEYIVDAATYLKNNNNTPPQLDGQAFQLVASPNRFGLDPFFELH